MRILTNVAQASEQHIADFIRMQETAKAWIDRGGTPGATVTQTKLAEAAQLWLAWQRDLAVCTMEFNMMPTSFLERAGEFAQRAVEAGLYERLLHSQNPAEELDTIRKHMETAVLENIYDDSFVGFRGCMNLVRRRAYARLLTEFVFQTTRKP